MKDFFFKGEYGNCSRLKKAEETRQLNLMHELLLDTRSKKRKKSSYWDIIEKI